MSSQGLQHKIYLTGQQSENEIKVFHENFSLCPVRGLQNGNMLKFIGSRCWCPRLSVPVTMCQAQGSIFQQFHSSDNCKGLVTLLVLFNNLKQKQIIEVCESFGDNISPIACVGLESSSSHLRSLVLFPFQNSLLSPS